MMMWRSKSSPVKECMATPPPEKPLKPCFPTTFTNPKSHLYGFLGPKDCTCEQQQNTRFPSRVDKRSVFQNTLGVPMGSSGFGGRSLGESRDDSRGLMLLNLGLVCVFFGGMCFLTIYSCAEPSFWWCLRFEADFLVLHVVQIVPAILFNAQNPGILMVSHILPESSLDAWNLRCRSDTWFEKVGNNGKMCRLRLIQFCLLN